MAIKFTRKPTDYISESAYMYDVAQTSKYFDKSVYDSLISSGNEQLIEQYVYGVAGARDKTSATFNKHDYDYLSDEDKAGYFLTTFYTDENSDEYRQNMAYYQSKVEEAIDKETYNSLNWFEKSMATVGGLVGNAVNETLLGTIEGLIDLGAVAVGQKDWAAKDITGVGANRESLQKFARAYSYLDKNKFMQIANDVTTGIAQMLPMIALNIPAPGLGTAVYFGAMAGNTAADAVRTNPDIDYLSLIGYTAATTGVELATEKISAGLFGGAGNFIDEQIFGKATGKGLIKLGEKATGNWVARVGLNFLSEGLEESIAEFANTALFNTFIAQGNDELRKSYSVEEILYAGLVGGLIGGLMEGGRIASQTRLSITKDGKVIPTKTAEKGTKGLTKTQSLVLTEKLSQASALAQTDAVADLQSKYSDLTLDEIKTQHAEEYENAVNKNQKTSDKMTEISLGLAKIYEMAGETTFKKAVDLANGVFENQQRLLSNYLDKASGATEKYSAIEKKVNDVLNKEYDGNVSFQVETSGLTAQQTRLKQNLKNKFGIDVYFGKLGEKNGNNRKFGLTISENEIILDTEQFGQMSEQEILNKVVKEELVHTLQFTKNIITPQTLLAINEVMGQTDVAPKTLDAAYEKETGLKKLTEAQAKAVAEVLLFDDLTVSKMFYTEYSTLNKVYRFFKNIKNKIEDSKELRSQKGKLKYNTLLKSMKAYREIARNKLGTAENVEQFIKDYQLTDLEAKQLRETYVENNDVGPIEGFTQVAFAKEEDINKALGKTETQPQQTQMELDVKTVEKPKKTRTKKSATEISLKDASNYQQMSFGDLLFEQLGEDKYLTEPTNDEIVKTQNEAISVKNTDGKRVADTIKNLIDTNGVRRLSEQQLTTATQLEYNRLNALMIADPIFSEITEENFDDVYKEISTDPTARALFENAMDLRLGADTENKFSKEFKERVVNAFRAETTGAAQNIGLKSAILHEEKPISNIVKQLYDGGFELKLTEADVADLDDRIKNKNQHIKSLEKQIMELEQQIKQNQENKLEYDALTEEFLEKTKELRTFKTGTVADILDWLINNAGDIESEAKLTSSVMQRLLDTAIAAGESGKNIGMYLKSKADPDRPFAKFRDKLDNVVKKLRSFRMWAMTSSPISWVRNWTGNLGMRALDGITNSVERQLSRTIGRANPDWIPSDSIKFNETKAGKDVYKHISDVYGNYIQAEIRGQNKYFDSEDTSDAKKAQFARAINEQKKAEATGFNKVVLEVKSWSDWGLNTGFFGDEKQVYASVCKNLGNLVASSHDYLLKGIESEKNRLLKKLEQKGSLVAEDSERLKVLEKALSSKLDADILDATDKSELKRLITECANKSFDQYFKSSNGFSKWCYTMQKKHPVFGELVSWVMPFPKVAVNIMKMAYRYSPAGFIRGIYQQFSAKTARVSEQERGTMRAEAIRAYSEASVGTFMLIAGALAAMLGWVDIDDDDYLGVAVNFGDDIRVSLSDLAPSMTTFSTAAAFTYGWKNDKGAWKQALNTVYDNTLLSNIENAFRYSTPSKYVENLSVSYFASYIPAVVKLANKWTTNSAYKDKSGNYFQKLIKTLGASVPGLSQLVPNKINPYTGEVSTSTGTTDRFFNFIASLSPLQIQQKKLKGAELEANRLGIKTSGLSGNFKMTYSDRTGKEYTKEYKLSNKRKEKYAKYRADYIETQYNRIESGKELVTILDKNTNKYKTVKYEKLTDDEKSRVLSNLYSKATEAAKIRAWLDEGNSYYVKDKKVYNDYKKLFGQSSKIKYNPNWKGSNFVEG